MKRFQIKPLIITTILLICVVGLRMYQTRQMNNRWNEELNNIVFVERIKLKETPMNCGSIIEPTQKLINGKLENKSVISTSKPKRSNTYKKKTNKPIQKKKPYQVNVNTNALEDWQQLHGIGEVLSARIIKFKNRLGGFYSIDQLKEVYGLSEETYNLINPFLFNSPAVKQIDLKSIEFKNLLRHPYFEYEDVKSIKNYVRKKSIRSKQALLNASKRDQNWVNKVWPYLTISSQKDKTSMVAGLSK